MHFSLHVTVIKELLQVIPGAEDHCKHLHTPLFAHVMIGILVQGAKISTSLGNIYHQ